MKTRHHKLNSHKLTARNLLPRFNAQGGMVLPLVAAGAVALFGFMALAIDVGHVMVVKAELQNAADAAALAGANNIYPLNSSGNFNALATAVALKSITTNKANGELISEANVEEYNPGYISVTNTSTISATSFNQSNTPRADVTTEPDAFKVRISKGGVASVFGKVVGFMGFSPEATSMAGLPSGFQINPGADGLFPIAMNKCLYDTYWIVDKDNPKNNGPLTMANGDPITFCLAGKDGDSDCNPNKTSICETNGVDSGKWTTLDIDANNVPTLRGLITSRNTKELKTGETIYLAPGEKTTLYEGKDDKGKPDSNAKVNVNACSAAGDKTCEYVVLPVVDWTNNDMNDEKNKKKSKFAKPIEAFACVRILKAQGGSDKHVYVQLMPPQSKQCRFKSLKTDITKVWSNNSYGLTATPILVH